MKYISFQSIDSEGDTWSNIALVFKDETSVVEFFNNPQRVIDTLGYELEEDEDINDCITIIPSLYYDEILGIDIILKYCGVCHIRRMSGAYIID